MRWFGNIFYLFWAGALIFEECVKAIFGRYNDVYSNTVNNIYGFAFAASLFIWVFSYFRIEHMYRRYSQELSDNQFTGFGIAEKIFNFTKLNGVKIQPSAYHDSSFHYSKKCKQVNLAERSYNKATFSAIGSAAHECAHIIQFEENYLPIKVARILGIVASIMFLTCFTVVSFFVFTLEYGTEYPDWARTDILVFGIVFILMQLLMWICAVIFELNANKRALNILKKLDVFTPEELKVIKKCLNCMFISSIIYECK